MVIINQVTFVSNLTHLGFIFSRTALQFFSSEFSIYTISVLTDIILICFLERHHKPLDQWVIDLIATFINLCKLNWITICINIELFTCLKFVYLLNRRWVSKLDFKHIIFVYTIDKGIFFL